VEQHRQLRAQRQPESMDDRMLKDLGIGRSEIDRVVRHGRGIQEHLGEPASLQKARRS
jgi:uncharacterized protein YjiS (DUF1127 family)